MNSNKELILIRSKSKVQWWTYFVIVSFILAFNACEKDNDNENGEEYPYLMVVNQNTNDRSITTVQLVGYEFNNLSISVGNSQTFVLDKGMPGGYKDINIKVGFNHAYTTGYVSKKVNFNKGEITIITFKGCISYEGCDGFYLE